LTAQISDPLQAATDWYLQLTSGEATDADYHAWKTWKEASAEHENAWKDIEAVTQPFTTVNAALGLAALDNEASKRGLGKPTSEGRRQTLKHLGVLFAVGASGMLTYQHKPWQGILADYTTQLGEARQLVLQDGTRLFLNTESMVAVDFTSTHRIVTLYKGEVMIETGHETRETYRPFVLQTNHGLVTALGTRFSARHHQDSTAVSLYEGSVSIMPTNGSGEPMLLAAGNSIEFNKSSVIHTAHLTPGSDAWTHGFLIVDKMALKDFLAELSRYRPGVLRCDPAIAHLDISGAFPINDTDAALVSIAKTLPIRIETFTRYWTLVKPA
jgi:transmembrane sensor